MADGPMENRDIADDKKAPFRPGPPDKDGQTPNINIMSLSVGVLVYPFTTFAKTLMQVNYEPVAAQHGIGTFSRKPGYYYPNVFSYVNHMRVTEGFTTLFTGITPRIASILTVNMVEGVTKRKLKELLPNRSADVDLPVRLRSYASMIHEVVLDCMTKTVGVVVSQPFHVIMLRMICSVINKDKTYQGFFSSIREIYLTEGWSGFFSGIVPRLAADVFSVATAGVGVWLMFRAMEKIGVQEDVADNMGSNYAGAIHFHLATHAPLFFIYGYVYPYYVTSTVYATSCPGLTHTSETYPNWRSCYNMLSVSGQLGRGQNTFNRFAHS